MATHSRNLLSLDEVRHVAKLARLELSDSQLEQYRSQLASVLEHIRKLHELDVTGVEPLAHPCEMMNRLEEDVAEPPMSLAEVLRNAPSVEGRFLAVPKVLAEGAGG